MATQATSTPEVPSVNGNLIGSFSIFLDPQSAARQVFYKWAWVIPVILLCIAATAQSLLLLPTVEHVLLTNPPTGVTPETIPRILGVQRIFAYFAPVMVLILTLIGALLIFGAAAVCQVKATFGNIFNLVAMSSLIRLLDVITSVFIVRAKGDDITSMSAIHPTVGLDFLVTDSTNKVLAAIMNFFSIPTLWAIVMTALTFAIAFKVSKTKGFMITSASWLLFLVFALVGAMFQR